MYMLIFLRVKVHISKQKAYLVSLNNLVLEAIKISWKLKIQTTGGPFVYISDFFEGVKVKFFRLISKQITYLVSLNTLVLESIKIFWELILYFSMKIKNSDHRGDPLYAFQIFSRVSKLIFFGICLSIRK